MKEFIRFVTEEQKGITKALQDVIGKMPASVQEITEYALLSGGKRLRPVLTLLWYHLLKNQQNTAQENMTEKKAAAPHIYNASIVLEMFHVASLLHDDVLDNADLRRGKTAAHLKFGLRPCLLAGDALLAMGNKQMANYNNPILMDIISDALLKTAVGEIEEIQLAGKIPAHEQEYLSVIEGKTAWIIRSACEVGAVLAGADDKNRTKARDFGLNLGMAFQIVDDALDFSPEEIIGKPAGGDLKERKCTPPVYMYMNSLSAEEKQDFIRKFQVLPDAVFAKPDTEHNCEKGFSDKELAQITQQIINAQYPEKTRALAQSYLDKAGKCLEEFSGPYKTMLSETLDYVKNRSK